MDPPAATAEGGEGRGGWFSKMKSYPPMAALSALSNADRDCPCSLQNPTGGQRVRAIFRRFSRRFTSRGKASGLALSAKCHWKIDASQGESIFLPLSFQSSSMRSRNQNQIFERQLLYSFESFFRLFKLLKKIAERFLFRGEKNKRDYRKRLWRKSTPAIFSINSFLEISKFWRDKR